MKMKRALLLLPLLFFSPVKAHELQHRNTYCNGYYNSAIKQWDFIPCQAWFKNQRLVGLKFKITPDTKQYVWWVGNPMIEMDKRWKECIRYTSKEGNQWQFCTVKSPKELNIL
jgi:hypothetical protein